jgi:hypothetical protein
LERTFTITKHPKIVGNWRKRFHHCTFSAKKQVATGIVRGAFEFQGQNVQQLLEPMFLKVYGQRLKNKLSLM